MKLKFALYISTLALSFGSTALHAQVDKDLQKQLDACAKIQCTDLVGKNKMECNKSKGLCFRKAFKKRVAIWKELGIEKGEKAKVMASLKETLKKNEELHKSILEEADYIKMIIDEVKGLQNEVGSLKPAK